MDPVLLRLDSEALAEHDRIFTTEWLETDGSGGYASSSVAFCPTRRQHGLLVATPPGHAKRHVFLARFEETVHGPTHAFPLSTARYPGVLAPDGTRHLIAFELAPWPSSLYGDGEVRIRREVLANPGGGVLVRYRNDGSQAIELELAPMLAAREGDALTFENSALRTELEEIEEGLVCRPYEGLPDVAITFSRDDARFGYRPLWYKSVEYARDGERGYPSHEDHFCPGSFRLPLRPGQEVVVAATLDHPLRNPRAAWKKARDARLELLEESSALSGGQGTTHARLAASAEAFLTRTPSGRLGIVAGYPWFGEWGRDTFVALPGLTLARGRIDECAEVLRGALEYLQDGLLPNTYGPSRAESHYGSADAALWFARAAHLYADAGGDEDLIFDALLPALDEIGEAYLAGTALGIRSDDGGLIRCGGPEAHDGNTTWMDARVHGEPVTPREGSPVEINALWYSLLAHLETLHEAAGDDAEKRKWAARKRIARKSFLERFWIEDGRYLADVWKDGRVDARVRPNMVIAAALELSPLTKTHRAGVVDKAAAELLTPFGLRTLSPRDRGYVGVYRGGPEERDRAYHQGTVWPWLLGFYVEANLRAYGKSKTRRGELRAALDPLGRELDRVGLDHLSEVYDGDPPHHPGGTIAQAWNTAELLRALALLG